jgi:hypothetical protein
LALLCFGLSPKGQAVNPPPDGGYPNFNTAEGENALESLTTGSANTAVGWRSLLFNTDASFNTGVGAGTLFFNQANDSTAFGAAALFRTSFGGDNTAVGAAALFNNTTGSVNTANGAFALVNNLGGSDNTAIGAGALVDNTSGNNNVALGNGAGGNLTTGSNNIDIGNAGIAGESDTIRIGGSQTKTFIAGITGVNEGSPTAVFINTATGQLGTVSSSRRFKKEIKPMDQTSEAILALKPVTFEYKSDSAGTPQFGLIAEEVADVNPDLVVRDENGEIYTVRYDAVNAMLLNEFLKEHRKMQELETTVAQQQKSF